MTKCVQKYHQMYPKSHQVCPNTCTSSVQKCRLTDWMHGWDGWIGWMDGARQTGPTDGKDERDGQMGWTDWKDGWDKGIRWTGDGLDGLGFCRVIWVSCWCHLEFLLAWFQGHFTIMLRSSLDNVRAMFCGAWVTLLSFLPVVFVRHSCIQQSIAT